MTSATTGPPGPPRGTRAAGRRLWVSVVTDYELEEHELSLLREAVRLVDVLDQLAAAVAKDGAVITDARGEPKAHPAVVEARQSRIALARVLAALRLPAGDENDKANGTRRPQRRVGARGVYQLGRSA